MDQLEGERGERAQEGHDDGRESGAREHDQSAQGPVRNDLGWRHERDGDRSDVYAREHTISFRGTRTPDYTWPPLQAGPHRGKGPSGYRRSDESIFEEACARLTDDGWLDASGISVTVNNSEITLEGTVNDRDAKRRAEDLVAAVRGVWDIHNRLRVRRPDDTGAGRQE